MPGMHCIVTPATISGQMFGNKISLHQIPITQSSQQLLLQKNKIKRYLPIKEVGHVDILPPCGFPTNQKCRP